MSDTDFKAKCGNCRFFELHDRGMGICRRYPAYQNRNEQAWCGEYDKAFFKVTLDFDVVAEEALAAFIPKKKGRPRK